MPICVRSSLIPKGGDAASESFAYAVQPDKEVKDNLNGVESVRLRSCRLRSCASITLRFGFPVCSAREVAAADRHNEFQLFEAASGQTDDRERRDCVHETK